MFCLLWSTSWFSHFSLRLHSRSFASRKDVPPFIHSVRRLIYSRLLAFTWYFPIPVGLFCLDSMIMMLDYRDFSPMCIDVPRFGICGNILHHFIMWFSPFCDSSCLFPPILCLLAGLDVGLCFFFFRFRVPALRGHDTWDFYGIWDMGGFKVLARLLIYFSKLGAYFLPGACYFYGLFMHMDSRPYPFLRCRTMVGIYLALSLQE